VMDYFRTVRERIFPVGRLDYHSEGLLIMTNDGDLDYILTHPSHEVTKTYEVTVRGRYSPKLADKMSRGVRIDTGITAPCEIEVLGYDKEKNKTKVKMVLHEGKNREIRKMMAAYHYPVFGLVRTGYAFLTPEGLSRGMSRRLTSEEVRKLYELYR
jgi:23S rRNA pseudouridine2605 synthase